MLMIFNQVAGHYAKALFNIANSKNALKETSSSMIYAFRILEKSGDPDALFFKAFLLCPSYTKQAKNFLISWLFEDKIDLDTLEFLLLLVKRDRIGLFKLINQCFFDLVYEKESILIVKLTSSCPMTASQQKCIAWYVKRLVGQRYLRVALKNDSSILGGFIIEFGSKIIDMSLRGRLKQMTNILVDQ
jgi:F-type H+-transporting ATPase subunit delta